MGFWYPSHRLVNGQVQDLRYTPLFEGPFLNGGNGRLSITYGAERLVLDVN